MKLSLNQLPIGHSGSVTALLNDIPSFHQACQNFGITPGSNVEVLRRSFGGPMQIKVMGTLYSIRQSDAKGIEVMPL